MKRGVWRSGIWPNILRHANRISRCVRQRKVSSLLIMGALITIFASIMSIGHSPQIGGSPKYVIISGANKGGGVLQRKGPKEWELEKVSIQNKKDYAQRHGYDLAVKDMTAKKRYTHEWRESWEIIDSIRDTMRQFPRADWFWWIDLNSYIMEPQRSLDQVMFDHINEFERNVSSYNPANFDLDLPYVDYTEPVSMVLSQDCNGFSLGSFFLRRSQWTDSSLDTIWDPVFYEQKHTEWIHSEQSALEYMYNTQAWVRSGIAFAPQRQFNAYPLGACGESSGDQRIHYQKSGRDFAVNLAGCDWGRDCWAEIQECKRISNESHRRRFSSF